MRTFALLLLISFLLAPVFSQKVPIKYGKVSEEEIELSAYAGAEAVILCDYGTFSFDGRVGALYFYRSRHLRIKILTEDGLKQARQVIPFYDLTKASFFRTNRSYELKAQTLNIDRNGKIVKSRLKAKYVHEGEADSVFNNYIEIDFPNVKVGSIIEYEINIPTIEIVNPDIWYFQHTIPVIHSEVRIICPENINYTAKTYNTTNLDISETTNPIIVITYPRGSLSFQAYQVQLVKRNIPPASSDLPDRERIYLKIMLEYASRQYYIPGMELLFNATDPNYKYKNKSEKQMTLSNPAYILYKRPSLDKLPEKLLKDTEFGLPLQLYMGIRDTINSITQKTMVTEQNLMNIYEFIRDHMTWNGTYRTSVNPTMSKTALKLISNLNINKINRSLLKPFEKQVGTNAEINFILINTLRMAGFKANPVLCSTSDKSYLDPSFFNMHQFNHIVALVEIDEKEYLLDAAQDNQGIILLETQKLEPFGLVIKNNEAFWIRLKESDQGGFTRIEPH